MAVAVGARRRGDPALFLGSGELLASLDRPVGVEARQDRGARLDALPAGCGGPQDDHRHPEPGRLLLEAARVGDDQAGAGDPGQHLGVGERRQQADAAGFQPALRLARLQPARRPGVHRERHRRDLGRQPDGQLDQPLEAVGVVHVGRPVGGQHDAVPLGRGAAGDAELPQDVDDRVAHHGDALLRHPLGSQETGRQVRGGEVQRRCRRGHLAVGLLDRGLVPRAQPGLQVRDGHPVAPRRQAEQRHGVGVAQGEDEVGPALGELPEGEAQDPAHPVRLFSLDHPAVVGSDAQVLEEGVREGGVEVLAGRHGPDREAGGAQHTDDGGQLDDLGARAERDQDLHVSKTSSK